MGRQSARSFDCADDCAKTSRSVNRQPIPSEFGSNSQKCRTPLADWNLTQSVYRFNVNTLNAGKKKKRVGLLTVTCEREQFHQLWITRLFCSIVQTLSEIAYIQRQGYDASIQVPPSSLSIRLEWTFRFQMLLPNINAMEFLFTLVQWNLMAAISLSNIREKSIMMYFFFNFI